MDGSTMMHCVLLYKIQSEWVLLCTIQYSNSNCKYTHTHKTKKLRAKTNTDRVVVLWNEYLTQKIQPIHQVSATYSTYICQKTIS